MLVPQWTQEDLWEAFFALRYVPHGGSGIPSLTEAELMEYDVERLEWLHNRIETQREAEAAAMKRK